VTALAKILFWLALALWIGAVVFVSFVVAPAVFGTVSNETAGLVMGRIFPVYYAFTAICGCVALAASLALWRRARRARAWSMTVVMLVVMLAATTYAGAVVNPRARALRPLLHQPAAEATVRPEFDRLHRRAVQLNGLVLLLGLVTLGVAAADLRLPAELAESTTTDATGRRSSSA
jgi:hypothetical protein